MLAQPKFRKQVFVQTAIVALEQCTILVAVRYFHSLLGKVFAAHYVPARAPHDFTHYQRQRALGLMDQNASGENEIKPLIAERKLARRTIERVHSWQISVQYVDAFKIDIYAVHMLRWKLLRDPP